MTKHDSGGILSSFYSIISGGNEGSGKLSESENAAKLSRECVAELQPELIVTESKFLRLDSLHELVKKQFYKARDIIKAGCVFPMVVVHILPHAEFGPNDYGEDVPHFTVKGLIEN